MSFVWGADNVDYLRRRHEALKDHPLFVGIEFSDDPEVIRGWAPLLLEGRSGAEPIAATFHPAGTDVDFGTLTKLLTANLSPPAPPSSTAPTSRTSTARWTAPGT